MIILKMATIFGVSVLLVSGCGNAQGPEDTTVDGPATGESAMGTEVIPASAGFSWIVPGELAAMPVPGRDRPLDQDAAFLEQEGIQVLVSLTEEPPDSETLSSYSIEQTHLPIQDYAPPTVEQMYEFVALVDEETAAGRPVGVHCTAGLGRSGTMAAAYLVSTGVSADDAITTIRELRPGSVETAAQEDAVRLFEETRDDHQ